MTEKKCTCCPYHPSILCKQCRISNEKHKYGDDTQQTPKSTFSLSRDQMLRLIDASSDIGALKEFGDWCEGLLWGGDDRTDLFVFTLSI